MPTARELAQRLEAQVHTISIVDVGESESASPHPRSQGHSASRSVMCGWPSARTLIRPQLSRAAPTASPLRGLPHHSRPGRLRVHSWDPSLDRCCRAADEPIVALGPMADNPGWSPRPRSWPEPLSTPRIVACVDGTEPSEQVLPLAAAWARKLEFSLTILTVIEDVPPPLRPDPARPPLRHKRERRGLHRRSRAAMAWRGAGV